MSSIRVSRLPGSRRAWRRLALASLLAAAFLPSAHADTDAAGIDLSELPIEQLMTIEVYSASKFVQKMSDAPSAVSVVTAADIRAFGWRTLADILRSMRGLHVSYDRNYSYLGARGFLRPGDYNTRFLLLVDGVRLNDSVYDQGAIGTEFLLDVDLIDRVEFVPGPGSSIYGANAFFGVINVITRRGRDIGGVRLAAEAGARHAAKTRLTFGRRGGEGVELLLSASAFSTRGEDVYFAEFDAPATGNGIARRLDYDRGQSVFAKAAWRGFNLTLARSERTKGMPTASFGQAFGDSRAKTVDEQGFIDLGYHSRGAGDSQWSGHVFAGRYDYLGDYVHDAASPFINRDGSHARWWGGEFKWLHTGWDGHKVIAGFEFRQDERRNQYAYDTDGTTVHVLLDDRRQGDRMGIYVQDEIALRGNVLLNLGLRHDRNSITGGMWNPRAALIWKPVASTSVKVMAGSAFRAPNAYERDYVLGGEGGQKANPLLGAERIRTLELAVEHNLAAEARVTASLFRNVVSNLITQTLDEEDGLLIYRNMHRAEARGAEAEIEKLWPSGAKLRASVSLQRAVDGRSGEELANAPRRLAKLNLSVPLAGTRAASGFEMQYLSKRRTLAGQAVAGYAVANWSVFLNDVLPGLDVTAGIYNLFDRRYADPGGEEHVQDRLFQDGRTWRAKLIYRF